MNLKLSSLVGKGDYKHERLVIKAVSNADIGDYIIMMANFNKEGEVTTTIRNTFWFPFKKVNARDLVVVYSKKGTQSEKELKDGTKAHFFYWGLDKAVWDERNIGPVLLHAPSWESSLADNL